ncbi:MAG: bifunctional enoyl-CoA hydratase/phosphate acetyltransferase [Chlamydiota bacterium]
MRDIFHEKNIKLIEQAQKIPGKLPVAIVYPMNQAAIEGAILAESLGLIHPIFIGPKEKMSQLAVGGNLNTYECIDESDPKLAAEKGVELVRAKKAFALLKGSLETSILLEAVLNKEKGIRGGRRISNCYICDTPFYHKLLIYTDVGINIQPDIKTKIDIILNACEVAHSIGIERPKIALLACLEVVKENIPSTVDAETLCKMQKEGLFPNAIIEGPLSFDIAFSKEIAKIKGHLSQIAGDPDIAVFPDLDAGNIAVKQLELFSDAQCGSLALGAKVPILITSRNTPAAERALSCALAKLYMAKRKEN